MKAYQPADIEDTIEKLATKNVYHSHGSAIDADEAEVLKLKVKKLLPGDLLWQQIWLLRTMCHHDCGLHGYSKLFESSNISSAVSVQKSSP